MQSTACVDVVTSSCCVADCQLDKPDCHANSTLAVSMIGKIITVTMPYHANHAKSETVLLAEIHCLQFYPYNFTHIGCNRFSLKNAVSLKDFFLV